MRNAVHACSILVALLVASSSQPAAAGAPETVTQLVMHPTDPNRLIMRYGNGLTSQGLFFSDDRGKSWKMMCGAMFAPEIRSTDLMTLTASGALLTGNFTGLWQGMAGGCQWSRSTALTDIWVTDIALDPLDPNSAFAATGSGNPGTVNGLFHQTAGGDWRAVGAGHEMAIASIRVVAHGAGVRIYETARRTDGAQDYLLRVSDDMGASFREHAHAQPLPQFKLVAVDPGNADRIVLSSSTSDDMATVFVSEDQGVTLREFLKVTKLAGVAFAPDGRLFIGAEGSHQLLMAPHGLWMATSIDSTPVLLNEDRVHCVTYAPLTDTLYVCRSCTVGTVDPSSGAFQQLTSFWDAREFASCDGVDSATACERELCENYCKDHYASAPLCAQFSGPQCGPTGMNMGMCDDGTAGPALPMGGTPSSSSGGSSAPVLGSAAAGPAAPVAPPGQATRPSAGCSALPPARGRFAFGWLGLTASCAALLQRSRRRARVCGQGHGEA